MEYFVYILKSSAKNWFYIGFTNDIHRRFEEHNLGKVVSTKAYRPFDLIFVQDVKTAREARNLEKFLKVRFNKEALLDVVLPAWRNW